MSGADHVSELNVKGPQPERRPITEVEILAFVVARIAILRTCEPTTIDPGRPFNELGIDSLDAIHLVNDLEQRFIIKIQRK